MSSNQPMSARERFIWGLPTPATGPAGEPLRTHPDTGSQAPACPECGAVAVPIVYGLPDADLFASADAGRVSLGGCVIFEDAPDWRCPRCRWSG